MEKGTSNQNGGELFSATLPSAHATPANSALRVCCLCNHPPKTLHPAQVKAWVLHPPTQPLTIHLGKWISPSVHPSLHSPFYSSSTQPASHRFTHSFTHLFTHLPVHPPIYPPIHPIHPPSRPPIYLPIHRFIQFFISQLLSLKRTKNIYKVPSFEKFTVGIGTPPESRVDRYGGSVCTQYGIGRKRE